MSNGDGAKAFGGVMACLALATLTWMLWQAQNSSTDTLERLTNQRLKAVEKQLAYLDEHTRQVTNQRLEAVESQLVYLDEHTRLVTNHRLEVVEKQYAHFEQHVEQDGHPVQVEKGKRVDERIASMLHDMRQDNIREIKDSEIRGKLMEMLREIETQFRHVHRLVQLLWQRVYEEPLPNHVGPEG